MRSDVKESLKRNRPPFSWRRAVSAYWLWAPLVGLVSAGIVFFLYLRTLAPTVLYYERPDLLDAAMFQVQVNVLGITHPTGYPTYLMLAHLFTYLPFGDPAYRVNLVSAVSGTVAVFLVFLAGLRLSGRIPAAAVGSLAFGVGYTFWKQTVFAEVYSLNAVFVSLVFFILLLWRDSRKDRYLLAAAFFMGLSLTHHLSSGILLPTAVLFIYLIDGQKLRERWLVLKGAGLFVLGLTPYLYLPIRGSMHPPIGEYELSSTKRFLEFVSAREYAPQLGRISPGEFPSRLLLFWGYFREEFHIGLLLVALVGLAVMLLRDRAGALLLGVPFLVWLAFTLDYDIFDFFYLLIPPYLVLALLMAVGSGAILDGAERLTARKPFLSRAAVTLLVCMPLLYLVASDAGKNYPLVDRSQDYEGRRIIETVAEKVAPNATVLHHRSPLWYMVLVEGRRRDLTLLSPWYPSRNPTRFWSDPSNPGPRPPRAESVGDTGVIEAREAASRGPVYALAKGIDLRAFERSGFSVIPVEEGVLYELVPYGHTPYTRSAGDRQEHVKLESRS